MHLIIDQEERAAVHERLLRKYHDKHAYQPNPGGRSEYHNERQTARVVRNQRIREWYAELLADHVPQKKAKEIMLRELNITRGTLNTILRNAR